MLAIARGLMARPARAAARRAVARAGAHAHRRALRRAGRAARRGHDHPAGRPDGGARAVRRRPRPTCSQSGAIVQRGAADRAARRPGARAAPISASRSSSSDTRMQTVDHGSHPAQCPRDRQRASRPTSASTTAGSSPIAAAARAERRDASTSAGRCVSPGFVETHIHLDKSCILERCNAERGDLEEAIGEVAEAEEIVHRRGRATRARSARWRRPSSRHDAHAHARRGRSRHRPARARRRAAADRGVRLGDRSRDLRLPAGRPAQQSRHRRADGRGPEERRIAWSARRPTPTPTRTARSTACSRMAREFDIDIDMHLDFGPTADDHGRRCTCAS